MDQTVIKAIDSQDAEGLRAILSHEPTRVNERIPTEGSRYQTLLHRAIPPDGVPSTDRHIAVIQVLLDCGAAVDEPGWGSNNGLCTPLTMAAWGGHTPLVDMLLAHGANPNGSPEQAARNKRPIDTAAEHGHIAVVYSLVEGGADYTLFHLIQANWLSRIEQFLQQYPEAAKRLSANGTPPLHFAADPAAAHLLITAGADLVAQDWLGQTALHVAITSERANVAKLLIECGVPLDLCAAAGLGDAATVEALLDANPDSAREPQADGTAALFYAAFAGDLRSSQLLLAHGAAVSPQSTRFWACFTPLHLALQRRHRELTTLLLDHGADTNALSTDADGYWPTPLHAAIRWGTLEDARLLLDHGADPNGGDCGRDGFGSLGTSGLSWAVFAGNEMVIRLLLERGLDLHHPNQWGALHLAAENGHVAAVRLLLEAGADVQAQDGGNETPLMRALRFGRDEVAEVLRQFDS